MKEKKTSGRSAVDNLAAIGTAVAAVGLLALQIFVEPERLRGATVEHIANIFFLILAVVCALLLAFRSSARRKKP